MPDSICPAEEARGRAIEGPTACATASTGAAFSVNTLNGIAGLVREARNEAAVEMSRAE